MGTARIDLNIYFEYIVSVLYFLREKIIFTTPHLNPIGDEHDYVTLLRNIFEVFSSIIKRNRKIFCSWLYHRPKENIFLSLWLYQGRFNVNEIAHHQH